MYTTGRAGVALLESLSKEAAGFHSRKLFRKAKQKFIKGKHLMLLSLRVVLLSENYLRAVRAVRAVPLTSKFGRIPGGFVHSNVSQELNSRKNIIYTKEKFSISFWLWKLWSQSKQTKTTKHSFFFHIYHMQNNLSHACFLFSRGEGNLIGLCEKKMNLSPVDKLHFWEGEITAFWFYLFYYPLSF